MLLISQNAYRECLLGDVGELDLTTETLVLLGIVVLETNLELNGLSELSLSLLVGGKDVSNGCFESIA